ncbi:NAD(P)-dependent oxidoreductase [Peptoniphilus catoniae]|uniref:NAD(P)-dependent oxidoreductase n=1 Tax=Peptoniphilus catoniae TaxID=1660341 RepID=UPI0010FE331D|nr:NAD(P)-dependent oxidoreductase [Peptoniphilus catoniae]
MKILITSRIPENILVEIKKIFDVDYHDSNIPLKKEEIIERLKGKDALLCPLSDKIDKEVIDSSDSLKIISNYGAGFDNIDLEAASAKNIIVTNAPAPSSAVSTAELAFSLILLTSRRLIAGEKDLKAGNFLGWRPTYFLGSELRGKTLGIIGMGNIGKNLAKRALGFEMKVIYNSRNRKDDIEALGVEYMERDEVIKNSDFLSLHTAFVKELKHMISDREFDLMKKDAYLINAARGPLVDENALIKALKENKIKGAGLDVYEFEPKVSEELMKLDNAVLLPHLGNATYEARGEMGEAVLKNLIDFSQGRVPVNKVN